MGAAGIGGFILLASVFVGSSLRCPDGHRSRIVVLERDP